MCVCGGGGGGGGRISTSMTKLSWTNSSYQVTQIELSKQYRHGLNIKFRFGDFVVKGGLPPSLWTTSHLK